MKIFKLSSIIFFSFFLMCAVIPQLSAREHRHRHHRSTSVSFNLNVAPGPRYVGFGCGYVERVRRPAYYERTTIIQPYAPVYRERIYCPYTERVIVERPYVERVYVQPYSYWDY